MIAKINKDILYCIEFYVKKRKPPTRENPRDNAQRGEMDVIRACLGVHNLSRVSDSPYSSIVR